MNILKIFKQIDNFFNIRRSLIFLISAILILFIAILVFSEGFNGGTYTLLNYNCSLWAFKNPSLFLSDTNPPFFTLLSAPFAQLGFKAFQFFNIVLGVVSAYFAYLIAKELKMKSPALAIAICCFTPIFMSNLFSGISEVLFGFITIFASYLFIKKRYTAGAIILSFLPLVKIEGYLILPIYAIFLANKKHYKEIAYLLVGIFIYSVVGLIAGKGFFWLANQVNLSQNSELYGTRGIFQYIKQSPGFFGIANEIFFVTGLVAGISLYFRKKKEYSHELMLVVLPFVVYFITEAIAWHFGIGNSKGLKSYMVAIVPLMAVMATRGLVLFSLMFQIIFKSENVRKFALGFAFVSVIIIPFYRQTYPIEFSNTDKTIQEASEWLKNNTYSSSKFFYTDPMFGYFHQINPYNSTDGQYKLNDKTNPENEIEIDEFFIADEKFATEQGINIFDLINSPYFELMRIIEPQTPTNVLGKRYMTCIFKRTERDDYNISKNNQIYNQLSQGFVPVISNNFNNEQPNNISIENIETELNSQNKYVRISRHNKYSINDTIFLKENAHLPIILQVEFKESNDTPDENLRYVVEAYQDNHLISKAMFHASAPQQAEKNQWHKIEFRVQVPEITNAKNAKIVTYFWNKRKKGFLIDDYSVSIKE